MSIPLVVAADGAEWESALLAAAQTDTLGIVVVRRCMDVVELVSVALTGQARVALMSSNLKHLDADVVDQLLVAGVTPVAVLAHGGDAEQDLVRAMGIRHVVASQVDPSVLASVVRGADVAPDPAVDERRFYSLPGPRQVNPDDVSPPASPAAQLGKVIAVWGPTGAPGRTTVAAELADEIARCGQDVLLIDADVYGGTLATRLGMLDESPGLAAACRMASTALLDASAVVELSWQLRPRLRLLTGIPLAQRWTELRPAAVESVLKTARTASEWIVVDLAFSIEMDEEFSFDSLTPRRNAATLAVLADADVVLVVGESDPVGMQRLTNALLELEEAGLAHAAQVVLNKLRPGFGPRDPSDEAASALERFAARTPLACLPYDRDALDACLAVGRSLAEIRPRTRIRKSFSMLAAQVTGVEAEPRARRHATR